MPPTVVQNNFAGGEWSPSLSGRTNLEKYQTAVRTMLNFYPHAHGGSSNRGGTKYIAALKALSGSLEQYTRLFSFEFSVYQNYAIELGSYYARLYADGGQVVGAAGNGFYPNNVGSNVWTASGGGGTNEYYLNEVPSGVNLAEVASLLTGIREDETLMDEGVVESLAVGEYGIGDADTIGQNTVYVRLTDGADPDTKADTFLEFLAVADAAAFTVSMPFYATYIDEVKPTQDADTLYLFHRTYAVSKLMRLAHAFWVSKGVVFGAAIAAPTSVAVSGAGTSSGYTVTTVNSKGEESVMATKDDGDHGETITWDAVEGVEYYNIYNDASNAGVFGWIAQATTETFTIPGAGITPDYTRTPPLANDPFDAADSYPAVGAFFEQRLVMASTNELPQDFWGSVTGSYENLNKARPVKNDDSYNFTISSGQVNEIRWIVPLTKMIMGTAGGEWVISNGSTSDSVTPSSIVARQQSLFGSSHIQPVVIGSSVLFVEASKKTVRDLAYSLEADSYQGGNLSLLANHLFDNYEIVDWAYQKSPDSIIWAVRNDGVLLGLTYLKEQEVFGWHRHETDGLFKSVASVKQADGSDDVYVIVERIVDGSTVHYVELFEPRLPVRDDFVNDIQDAFFVDSGLSLDTPLTITGATKADPVVITSVAHGLSNGDKVDIVEVKGMTELNGNRYTIADKADDTFELTDVDGNDVDGSAYTTYISSGKARKAVTAISGLAHLEGKAVAVLANGSVVNGLTVASGAITLPLAASRVHVGLPYTCDLETLNLEHQTQTGTAQDKVRNVSGVVIRFDKARQLHVGPDEDNLDEIYFREDEDYDEPTGLFTGDKDINIEAGEPREAVVFMRVTDPVPVTVLSVMARMETSEE